MVVEVGLAFIGLLLIYFEFFVSGGILGILGGLLLIAGFILTIWEQADLIWAFSYLAFVIVLLILIIRLALWKIKKTKDKNYFYLQKDQEGYIAASYDKSLIGETGEALTALKPSGHIKVNQAPYQAVSESGYIKKGTKIKIIRGEGARFIVKEEMT